MKFNIVDYCNEKLWLMRSRDLPLYRRMPLTAARVVVLTARRFLQNQCTVKASALTFYTVFSIVPVLALIFGLIAMLPVFSRFWSDGTHPLKRIVQNIAAMAIFLVFKNIHINHNTKNISYFVGYVFR